MSEQRIGFGYDVHRTSASRKLVLGGVEIKSEFGLLGHSDADVLLHAIIDAILGALAKGDIGSWFPDTDSSYKDADSGVLFRKVWSEVSAEGWSLGNLDATVVTEAPKLRPYIDEIRTSIAELFDTSLDRVSVKATTSEKMGFIGVGDGMAAYSTLILSRN